MDEDEPTVPGLIVVREIDGEGRGYFLDTDADRGSVEAGTTLLDDCKAVVSAVNDAYESRNCFNCLQPPEDTGGVEVVRVNSRTHNNSVSPARAPRLQAFSCNVCQRSVLCSTCYYRNNVPTPIGSTSSPHEHAISDGNPNIHRNRSRSGTVAHGVLECEALTNLSKLQRAQPNLAESLLGANTIYLRLLLQLLALRARQPRRTRDEESEEARSARERLEAVEELEDHLDDLLDGGELEARVGNTIGAAKLIAPAAWKASQDECASFLGKLYCNSMTIGKPGVLAPLVRRGYWSRIRGCLYTDFGVGLFPRGAMFNHSCAPNCAWRTDDSGILRVVAARDIARGEQLCISYVDILQSGPVRRDLLREHYFFHCACSRCRGTASSRRSAAPTIQLEREEMPHQLQPVLAAPAGSSNGTRDDDDASSDDENKEDLVTEGWICHRRACCRRGLMLRPPGGTGASEDNHTYCDDDDVSVNVQGATPMAISQEQEYTAKKYVSARSGGRCRTCRGFTEEAYFDRWEKILGAKLSVADADLSGGCVREGRRKLEELQSLCERRLVATHSFSLGVLSRLVLGAAADRDWPAVVDCARRTLACIRGVRAGIIACSEGGGDDVDGAGSNSRGEVSGDASAGDDSCEEYSAGSGISGNSSAGRGFSRNTSGRSAAASTSTTTAIEVVDPTRATAVWEAAIVEVLERALPLANVREGIRNRQGLHANILASAERAATVLGLRRTDLVDL